MAAATASSAPSPPVTFGENVAVEQRGDVAEIIVQFNDAQQATLRIGSGANPVATVTVRDEDGDDRATVRLNTYDGTVSTTESDAVVRRNHSNVTYPLAVETYDLGLWAGNDTDGERWDVASLVVESRSSDSLRTWAAPKSANLSTLADVEAARESGNLTRASVVARNDTLVLELRASGLEGAIAAENGSDATARFSSWLDASGASLDVVQTAVGPERVPLHLNVTDSRATTVIPDARNDSYYVVVDTERVPVSDRYGPTGEENDLRTSEYRANFTLTGESALANGRESITDDFEILDREATTRTGYNRERVLVQSAPNRTVPVRTTLAPGSKVTVVVDGEGDSFRFSATGRVQNSSDGDGGSVFAPSFDFSGVAPGTNFTVTASHRGNSLMGYGGPGPGTVTEPSASVELGTASKLDVDVTAELSYGGFVVVRRNSVDGELLGNSRFLAPGAEETVLVSFDPDLDSNATLVAVAFRDTNGNGEFDLETDEPYTTGGDDHRVATSETVTFEWSGGESEQETTTDATTGGTTESPMRNATTTEVVTEPKSPTEPNSPAVEISGFGVGSALAGLVAGLLLARKRG